ncbi:ATP-binding protein [Bacteroides uniformis]|nr:ATP-binding protein [Bacteroides uniformis]
MYLERIFIPFFTTKPSGSGIGLTISRQIMHQHNGNITVSSHLGEGSTFTLLFPSI